MTKIMYDITNSYKRDKFLLTDPENMQFPLIWDKGVTLPSDSVIISSKMQKLNQILYVDEVIYGLYYGGNYGNEPSLSMRPWEQINNNISAFAYKRLQPADGNHCEIYIDSYGDMYATGSNLEYQLGLPENRVYPMSTKVETPGQRWKEVATSGIATLAINLDGSLWGCGNTRYFALGGLTGDTSDPTHVHTFTKISNGPYVFVCANGVTSFMLDHEGNLYGLGRQYTYQTTVSGEVTYFPVYSFFPTEGTTEPVQIGTKKWKHIHSANGGTTTNPDGSLTSNSCILAIDNEDNLYGCGVDRFERYFGLGPKDPNISGHRVLSDLTPTEAGSWKKAIVTGYGSYILSTDGTIYTTGTNDPYDSQEDSNIYMLLDSSDKWIDMDGDVNNITAINSKNQLYVAGRNENGQLGIADTLDVVAPLTRVEKENIKFNKLVLYSGNYPFNQAYDYHYAMT